MKQAAEAVVGQNKDFSSGYTGMPTVKKNKKQNGQMQQYVLSTFNLFFHSLYLKKIKAILLHFLQFHADDKKRN